VTQLRGQAAIIFEICVALSAALERTEEKFEPFRDSAEGVRELEFDTLDDVLRSLEIARGCLINLALYCQDQQDQEPGPANGRNLN